MTSRPGITLTEVLVAIFVMALGMLSLLALFPLGALTMAQAIKDSRSAHAAANATAIANALKIRFDSRVTPSFTNSPGGTLPNLATNAPANYIGPSYPVVVDTYTAASGTSSSLPDASTGVTPGLPRVTITSPSNASNGLTTAAEVLRWFSLLDDITFTDVGMPDLNNGGNVTRDNRYSWFYVLRRPLYSNASVVDVTVVVCSGRPLNSIVGEHAWSGVSFDPTSNSVTLSYTGDKPPIRPGSWIMDATLSTAANNPEPYGFFYRVVGVADTGAGTMTLELQTNPRPYTTTASPTAHTGTLVFMENVVEVFEKGSGWQP
jgi:Tfp pilus assembly protein PilV